MKIMVTNVAIDCFQKEWEYCAGDFLSGTPAVKMPSLLASRKTILRISQPTISKAELLSL